MQSSQQLSTFPAAEGFRRSSLEEDTTRSQGQKASAGQVNDLATYLATKGYVPPPPPPPQTYKTSKIEKRTRRPGPSIGGPYLHPLPTIETLMSYPSISRPVYDSLVRGEPPAQTYKTVIHTPKPQEVHRIDENLLRAADFSDYRRRKRANSGPRSRSNTGSSTASSSSGSSTSSVGNDSDSSASDISEPGSPVSVSSTSKATVASSRAASPKYSLFPSLPATPQQQPTLQLTAASPALSIESDIPTTCSDQPSYQHSPAQSFRSTTSNSSWVRNYESDSEEVVASSSRSSAPSPASSAYPSPPSSPNESRRSSSSGEEFMTYPSPPSSPSPTTLRQQRERVQHRERRAFSSPARPSASASASLAPPKLRRRSASLTEPMEFDLGEQVLGGGGIDDDDDINVYDGVDFSAGIGMDWSMNGGELVFVGEEDEGDIFFGSAGLALSPRALKGNCGHCDGVKGLGLYVIDEEDVEVEEDGERACV